MMVKFVVEIISRKGRFIGERRAEITLLNGINLLNEGDVLKVVEVEGVGV